MLTNTYATTLTTKNFARKMLFPLCLIEHITNKEDLKEKASIKQVSKENGYQESIISKIFLLIRFTY